MKPMALVLLLGFLAPLPVDGAPPATPTLPTVAVEDLESLRKLEGKLVETIERSRKAFVFIAGGSGFLVSADGYILTNEHVVGGRNEIVVQLTDGKNFRARTVGHDPEGDVALLKIEGEGPFPWLELGDSDALRIGQQVIAMGDPFLLASQSMFFGRTPPDFEPSVSLGIVSALHRYSDTYSDAIQVDVAVNRGNSGGPLLDLNGKVVGINGKIETRFAMGVNSGVGYAVPSNQIRNFLDALKAAGGGKISHGVVHGVEVDERAAGKEGLPVAHVEEGSAAAAAGMREGDLIVAIEGMPVATQTRYRGILSTYPVGREVTFRLSRGSDSFDVKIPVEARKPAFLGVETESGPQGGALVKTVATGSPADVAGIKVGDVIVMLRATPISSPEDLKRVLDSSNAGEEVLLGLFRDGKFIHVKLRLGIAEARVAAAP